MALLVLSVMPMVFAAGFQTDIPVDVSTEDFEPKVWMCDHRVFEDDAVEPSIDYWMDGIDREQNYAFEGESISWKVLVMDKNGINKVEDVFVTLGETQGGGNIEANCIESDYHAGEILDSCNARIGEEELEDEDWDSSTMRYYECTLTVETADSMYDEYWITVEALDLDGLSGTVDENEYWFFNPVISLDVEGALVFEDVRPGTSSYSETILIGNDADPDSGVKLNMFIAGTNFYDSTSSGAMCPNSNVLDLENFKYFASNGAYSTLRWGPGGSCVGDCADAEGYMSIPYGERIDQAKEIMGTEIYNEHMVSDIGNELTPGSDMALTFRLDLPEPCNGDFNSGSIYFWGEAI